MPLWSALGGLAGGVSQGLDQQSMIAQRAQQIQAAQFALDQQKQQLAGQAAAFQSLIQQGQAGQAPQQQIPPSQGPMPSGPPPPQTGQPPMPGQASVPMQQPPAPQLGPGQVPPPVQGPGMAPQGQPQQPMQQPQGQPQGQQPGLGGQDLSPQGQLQIIAQIAMAVKKQNPGVDPATLFQAVKEQIGLLGALSNSQKAQLVLTTDQIRQQTQERGQDIGAGNVDRRVQGSEDVANIGAASREKVGAGHDATSASNTDKRIADADKRLTDTQAAINARQDNSLNARATKNAQTERAALLKTQLSQAKQKLAAANASGDATQMAAAQKGVDAAYAKVLDFQTKVMGGKTAAAAGKVVDFSALPP